MRWMVLVGLLVTGVACGGTTEPTESSDDKEPSGAEVVDCGSAAAIGNEVDVVDNAFEGDLTTITAPETVRWTVQGSNTHTVTSGDFGSGTAGELFDSGDLSTDDTFCVRFTEPGEYPYHCIPHASAGMTGTIEVE